MLFRSPNLKRKVQMPIPPLIPLWLFLDSTRHRPHRRGRKRAARFQVAERAAWVRRLEAASASGRAEQVRHRGDVGAERAGAQGWAERHQGGRSGRIRCLDAAPGGTWPWISTVPVCGSRRVSDRARLELNPSLFVLPLLPTESRFVSFRC